MGEGTSAHLFSAYKKKRLILRWSKEARGLLTICDRTSAVIVTVFYCAEAPQLPQNLSD